MKSDTHTIDLVAKIHEVAACPVKTARVRAAISGAARDLMLDEIARRRTRNGIKKK